MNKLDLLKQLRELQKVEDAYLDSLPPDLYMTFIENGYSNAKQQANELLIEAAFGELADEVGWFLYEYSPSRTSHIIEADGTEWTFEDDEAYYKYFERLGK